MAKNTGTVIQIMGPVLDIRFAEDSLPNLLDAIEVDQGDHKIVAEVEQHIGDNVVRCVAMSSTDGLRRGAEAVNTGRRDVVHKVFFFGRTSNGRKKL